MRNHLPHLLLFVVAVAVSGRLREAPKHCKVTRQDADRPAAEEWDRLNTAISGRLIKPVPPGGTLRNASRRSPSGLIHRSILVIPSRSIGTTRPTTRAPDPEVGCSGVGYPFCVANATEAEHVQAGVDFGR
ncbi:hypothetical protein PpBr36_00086 [Pyricularia pennisetigena]|uniref:hypothetical protein n=1 Tax=Pyricularia pennisetigena TaxID=1578925 RepID=UPI001152C2B5|nr:hypothetical protein PpBr36_00086 [Pyricularia pennisetigena]TLS29029.1 hypothetical protein PpBr36_00086 [Pyricularia pennisetigena]